MMLMYGYAYINMNAVYTYMYVHRCIDEHIYIHIYLWLNQ